MFRQYVSSFFSGFRRRDVAFSAIVAALVVALWFLPTGFEDRLPDGMEHVRGEVLSVDDSLVRQYGFIRDGVQVLEVRISEGTFKGTVVRAENRFMGKLELDKVFRPGDTALVDLTASGGRVAYAHASDHYRVTLELALLGAFALLLLLFGGFAGFQALLSFLFTALAVWKLVIPLFLKGWDPLLVSLAVVTALTAVIVFLVAGLGLKGFVAFCGATVGLVLTGALALAIAPPFRLHGAVRPFSETLLYSGFGFLDLTRIFLSGIFLASSGAVMDLAMELSAALREIAVHTPGIGATALFRSGILIGRSVIGTMTTTLLLAYSGSYVTMLMVFMGQGIPLVNVFNMNYTAAEFLHTLVGSFGLVLVAPLTAAVGAFAYSRDPLPEEESTPAHEMR